MTQPIAEQDLLELERRYWQALKEHDVDTALALTDEPCIVTGAQGVGEIDKRSFASMMDDPTYRLVEFRIDDPHIRVLDDDSAVLAYTVHEDLVVDGEPVRITAADTSTWVRRGDRWLCAVHTESILGDPFGRDRT